MWRSITAVVLLPALAAAQNSSVPAPFLQGDLPRPTYHALTDEQTIRQGASGNAYLLVSLGNDAIVSPRESSRGVVPLKIEFDSADGITATSVSFPPHAMMRVALQNREPLHASLDSPVGSAAKAGGIARTPPAIPSPDETARIMAENPVIAVLNPVLGIRFKVKVPKSTPLGTHQIHGRITYQPIRAEGVFPPQQLDVVVPITVVDRNARIQRNTASAHTSASNADGNHDWIWMILLAPILIPLSILAALEGMDC